MTVNDPNLKSNTVSSSGLTPGTKPLAPATGVNSLFRFLYISDPSESVQPGQTTIPVIAPPEPTPGSIMATVMPLEDPNAIFGQVQTMVKNFKPYSSYRQVIDLNKSLFEFCNWLKTLTVDTPLNEIVDQRQKLRTLTQVQETALWDNLVYQAIKSTSTKITDAIVIMLRANSCLKQLQNIQSREGFNAESISKIQQLSRAFITIPSKIIALPKNESLKTKPFVDANTQKGLLNCSNRDIARFRISQLKKYIRELQCVQTTYFQKEAEAFEKLNAPYQEKLRKILSETDEGNGEEGQMNAKQRKLLAALEPIDYKAQDQLDFLEKNVSTKLRNIFSQYRKPCDKTILDIVSSLEAELGKQYKLLLENQVGGIEYVAYAGLTLSINNQPQNTSSVVRAVKVNDGSEMYSLFITEYFNNGHGRFRKVNIRIIGKNGGSFSDTAITPLFESDNYVTYLFFSDGIPYDEYGLQVNYQLVDENYSGGFSEPQFMMTAPSFNGGIKTTGAGGDGLPGNADSPMYGVTKIGVGNFMKVEQEVCCYVAGEVSHIENIMAREYKEKATRELNRFETVTEEATEREVEKLSDTTSTERHELNSEVARTLQEDRAIQIGANAGVSGKIMEVNFHADANFNSTQSSSTNNSFNQAESYAKDIVERSMERIVEKMTYKRASRMLREFEQTNKHGFDNREGSEHVTGIYRWVDKIYENRVMNYGKRLMYSFIVPEPAKNFKKWMTQKYGSNALFADLPPTPPPHPKTLGLYSDEDVNRSNYADLAGVYGVQIEPCPPAEVHVGKPFAELVLGVGMENEPATPIINGAKKYVYNVYKYEIEIPENYGCNFYYFSYVARGRRGFNEHRGTLLTIGDNRMNFDVNNDWVVTSGIPVNQNSQKFIIKNLPVSLCTEDVGAFNLNVIASCELLEDFYNGWRSTAYTRIWEGYQRKLNEYKDALTEYEAKLQARNQAIAASGAPIDYNFNPLYGRAIEQRELKRLSLELMLAPFFASSNTPFNNNPNMPMGANHYDGIPGVDDLHILRNAFLDQHAEYIKFLESAFDWDIMAYVFYPYYWGDEYEWADLIKESSTADFIFQSFLQSGMARLTVPVMPGFEEEVLYFLDTGRLLKNKGLLPGTDNDTYEDVLGAMQLDKPTLVGNPWHTRMPTALTIIQTNAAPLNADGLPCGNALTVDDAGEYCEDGTPIATGASELKGLDNSNAKDKVEKPKGKDLGDVIKV